MDNMIHIEEFIRKKSLNREVIPFFQELNLPFQSFQDQNDALFIVKTHTYLFIFLTFINKNTLTSLPSIQDRFHDIKHNPRTSKGEWVVECIYDVEDMYAKRFLQKLHQTGELNIPDLKNNINK